MTLRALILALATACPVLASMPEHVRVWTQYIEVPHSTLSGWLNGERRSGQEIHVEAVKLAKEGGAKIIETNMVICRSGQKATIESIREEIYPTENYPPALPGTRHHISTPYDLMKLRANTPAAFETRNTGVTLEVEPTIGENPALVDLRVVPEIVTPLRLDTHMEHVDQWGDASMRMPVYETWRSNTSLMLNTGRFELLSVIAPKGKLPSPMIPKRILLFVRADVVPLPILEP